MNEQPDTSAPTDVDTAPAAAPEAPTVGTGSSLGIGCMVLMLVIFLALAAVFFLPYLR